MITVSNVRKTFGDCVALDAVRCTIPSGCVYGVVGSNGAGKSTLLRLITGVYRADQGQILLDANPVYENPEAKQRFAFVPDALYFLPQSNLARMEMFYAANYRNFHRPRFAQLLHAFGLDAKANLQTFSGGMKRLAALALALGTQPDYLFLDETMDGLDPAQRAQAKNAFYQDVESRGATVVVTSHSLREMEDTCDHLALLHRGSMLLQSEVENLKTSLYKVQIAFADAFERSAFASLPVLGYRQTGSVATLVLRGQKQRSVAALETMHPLLFEILPLTLEEVFLHEMQALGYPRASEGEDRS